MPATATPAMIEARSHRWPRVSAGGDRSRQSGSSRHSCSRLVFLSRSHAASHTTSRAHLTPPTFSDAEFSDTVVSFSAIKTLEPP